MLGHLLVIVLALSIAPFVFIQDVFANSFDLELDREEYYFGDTLLVSGTMEEVGMPVVAMSIYDPDGMILVANSLEISSDGNFSKTISLSSPSYEKIGEYLMEFHYGKISESVSFTMMSGESDSDSKHLEQESNEHENDEPGTVSVFTDKSVYTDNDTVTIYGTVSKFESPTVLLGVYDPFGMPTGFYFGNLNSENEFSTSFLVKAGVNFRVDGTYDIKAHYGDLESNVSFDFQKELENNTTENNTTENNTSASTSRSKSASTSASKSVSASESDPPKTESATKKPPTRRHMR